jgi:hypothetical protein
MAERAGVSSRPIRPPLQPVDRVLIGAFCVFAFTSIFMEPYIVFAVDLRHATDPLGRLWHFYASHWDPLFFDHPFYMRVMTGIDEWVYGPMYLLLIYAFVRRANWIRTPALLYGGAIIYSTLVYFLVEFLSQAHRANLAMVLVVNIPYTVIPGVLVWRMWAGDPFPAAGPRSRDGIRREAPQTVR